ncbi:N-acetylmuramoyl-L-alanine amidase [Rubellicoccus peritrichatus]|uniref:N-acetylmuramoyl-L-alanine amidase n=1 Tax=Rubellicoccus peritrichatus TaxID=3080537 RepID=A0AAQ3QV13_9BACT|nr:N-acetylmuramoyl-L-alanine amidase [Puniceicoccus sp. CR14]WOO42991.1 N-acetylmuramoyl-L-alanine amidase [Puniceicoccus sp. CR14]
MVCRAEPLEIIQSPMPEPTPEINWYRVPEEPRVIDTVVIHYTSALGWFNEDFQEQFGEQVAPVAEKVGLTPENLNEHKFDFQLNKAIFVAYGVSAHYIIDRDGTIYQLVPDEWVAWHAGVSKMPSPDDREMVNTFSIGIELLATHPDDDPSVKADPENAFTEAQYASLEQLMEKLTTEYPITAVVGHDEIAPDRKKDPGPLFDWSRVRHDDLTPH